MASLTRKIGEGTIFLTVQRFLTTLLSIGTSLIIIGSLGQFQYGLLVLTLSVVTFFSSFLDFGLGLVVSSDIASYRGQNAYGKIRKLIKDFFFMEVLIGALLFSSVFVTFYFFSDNTSTINKLAIIASFLLLLIAFKNIFLTVINAFTYFKWLAFIQLAEIISKFILVIVVVFVFKKGLLWIISLYVFASFIAVLIAAYKYFKVVRSLKKYEISKEYLLFDLIKKHGKWQGVHQMLKNGSENLKYWVLTFFVGLDGVAIYNVGVQIVSHLQKLNTTLESVLIPILSEELSRGRELAKKVIDRSIKYSLWLSLITIVAGWLVVPPLLYLLFGEKYLLSIPVFLLYSLSLPAAAIGVVLRPIYFHLKKQKQLFFIGLWLNIIATPIYIILTFFFGTLGYAFPIADYLGIIMRYRTLIKKDHFYKVNWKLFFIWDSYDKELFIKIKNYVLKKLNYGRSR